jgi:hypothetical protein
MTDRENHSRSADASGLTAGQYIAPIVNFNSLADGDHLVQFYETDSFLIQTIAAFTAQGLAKDESVIVIATPDHRTALEAKLKQGGVDLAAARAIGRFSAYDAQTMLDRFMVYGHPDRRRFRAQIGPIVELASMNGAPIRAFGEMVHLLWQERNKDAAVELEFLWNDLADHYRFSLLCAYSIANFSDEEKSGPLRHICRAHTCVIPHESYCDLDKASA